MVLYLKDKDHRVEIKTAITGYDLKLMTMMFVDNGYFPTLGKITESQWEELL